MSGALAWAVLVPLIGALLCLLGGRRAERWLALLTLVASLAVTWLVAALVKNHGVLLHLVGGWGAPLGITLRADGLAAVSLACVSSVAVVICAPAVVAARPAGHPLEALFPLWFVAWAALNALFLSADIFNLYVTLELMTLASVGLIALGRGPEATRAALRYLLFALAGSLSYLLGVVLLYGGFGTLGLATLGGRLAADPLAWAALSLIAVGLALKSGLFPLHGWLPAVYVSARSTVSALLSALVSLGAYSVLLRVWLEVMPAQVQPRVGTFLGVLGAGGVLWGSLMALRQSSLRALLAYSSVAQVGYLFLVFPLATPAAFSGGVYLAVSHAAAKASLFLAASTIRSALGHDELKGLRGLAGHLPITFFSLALAGTTLMGVPPSGGFVAKWLMVSAALAGGQWWWAAVIVVGGLMAAGYMFKVLRAAFLPSGPAPRLRPLVPGAELGPFALAVLSFLLGIAPRAPLELLAVGWPS